MIKNKQKTLVRSSKLQSDDDSEVSHVFGIITTNPEVSSSIFYANGLS